MVLVVAAAAAAYANSFSGAFQFDDIPAILENPSLRHLWPLWVPLSPPVGGLTVSGRPVLNLTLALNYALSTDHPWSYHLLNLVIHAGAALALFGIVRRTLARIGTPGSYGSALAVALLWAVHPLTTEAVTYIVQRAESLMALFYLLTLYCFIRSVDAAAVGWRIESNGANPGLPTGTGGNRPPDGFHRSPTRRRQWSSTAWPWLAVLCCWLGMGTKEVMVSAPVAVYLYDRTFVAGSWTAAWTARRGFYLSLAAGWIPLILLVAGLGWDRGGTFGGGISWFGYWLSQGEAVFRYLGLALWPHPLAVDYGPPTAPPALAGLLAVLVLAAFAITVVGCRRGRRWAFLPGVFFLVLAPTSVMPGILQFAAEHRMYLPLAPVVTAVVLGVRWAAERVGISSPARRLGLPCLLGLAVIGLASATAWRNRAYADDLSLWMDTIAKRPLSALAEANAGKVLLDRGRLDEGMAFLIKAVALDPDKPIARYNLGLAYENRRRWEEALAEFVAVAKLNPRMYLAEFRAGLMLNRLGRPAEAENFLRQALALEPDFAEARGCLGEALSRLGHPVEAAAEFEHSLLLKPDQPEVEFNLGVMLARQGRLGEALTHYSAAARLAPDYGEARLNRGVTLAELGRLGEALSTLQSAARLLPDSPEAHENLATALDQSGRADAAIPEYRIALRLRPDYAEAHYNLGNALIHTRDLAGARAEFAEALRLKPDLAAARAMLDRLANFAPER